MTIDICQTARESGVKQFIFLSSMNVYGDDCGIVTDKNNENPSSFTEIVNCRRIKLFNP